MPFRTDIPGQISIFQLRAIEIVAGLVPAGGAVVEVGSLFGRSSYAWGASVDPSVTVHCIDPWERNEGVRSMEKRFQITYGIEQFEAYTKHLPNVRAHKGYSPADFSEWADPVDLYYEDAVHTDPILDRNLTFWTSRLKPDGIVCGDDYRPRFPDVRNGAARLAEQMGREIITVDHFWCLLPNADPDGRVAAAAARLRELSKEAQKEQQSRGFRLRIGANGNLAPVPEEGDWEIEGRVYIDSPQPWPARGKKQLWAGARIIDAEEPHADRIIALSPLGVTQLLYDEPIDFTCRLPAAALTGEPVEVVFDLFTVDQGWLLNRNPETAHRHPVEFAGKAPTAPEPARSPSDGVAMPGERVQFTLDGRGQQFQGEGWIGTEKQHTWTRGEISALQIKYDQERHEHADGVMLSFSLRPFVRPPALKSQPLRIAVNGEEGPNHRLKQRTTLSMLLPAREVQEPVMIQFQHPEFTRPCDVVPGSTDRKPLAMAFEWFSMVPVYTLARRPGAAESG
ncbi:class I SAM-dependent methyltransferase [Parvularcula oceani]|uniref:class I SAM-dependent methyltransferase n=1 Tax=Parvularcula oceani TaxID=1247963 RepID=UPI0004E0E2B1|nr:class I SAM-dependent methyltransferase [Parvularcula oceani]